MPSHAVDDVEDAYRAARGLLLPFDAGRWLKLVAVVFFLGETTAGSSSLNVGFSGMGLTGVEPNDVEVGTDAGGFDLDLGSVDGDLLALLVAVAAVAVVVAVVYALVGSIMEFVLVESLRTREVRLRRYLGRHWGKGLRLFGFRAVVGALALAPVAALVGLVVLPLVDGSASVGPSVAGVVFLVLLAVLVGVLAAAVLHFTSAFVVPTMLVEDCGVVAGWRRFWPTLRAEWQEYGLYAALFVALTVGLGTVVSILVGVAAAILLVPLGLVGATVFFGGGVALPVVVVLGLLLLLAMLVVVAVVAVPVQVYLRYYALFVLGDTDDDLDPIPEVRADVRS